jgi:hypothetical protein
MVVSWRARRPAVAVHADESAESTESQFQLVLRRSGAIELHYGPLGVRDSIVGLFSAPHGHVPSQSLSPCLLVLKTPLMRLFSSPTDVQCFAASPSLLEFRLRFVAPIAAQLPESLASVSIAIVVERNNRTIAHFGVAYAAAGAPQTLYGHANNAPPYVPHALASDDGHQLSLVYPLLALDGARSFRWRLEIGWSTSESPDRRELSVLPWSNVALPPPSASLLAGAIDLVPPAARSAADGFVAPFGSPSRIGGGSSGNLLSRVPSVPDFVGQAFMRMRSETGVLGQHDNDDDANADAMPDMSVPPPPPVASSVPSKRGRKSLAGTASNAAAASTTLAVPATESKRRRASDGAVMPLKRASAIAAASAVEADNDGANDSNNDDESHEKPPVKRSRAQAAARNESPPADDAGGQDGDDAGGGHGDDDGVGGEMSAKERSSAAARVIDAVTAESPVTLDKYVLQMFSIEEFEEYFLRITQKRSLSPSDQREVQRQRRLLKNRQSAQSSRQKRKQYIDALEKQIADLKSTNEQLRAQVASNGDGDGDGATASTATNKKPRRPAKAAAAAAAVPPPPPRVVAAPPPPPPPVAVPVPTPPPPPVSAASGEANGSTNATATGGRVRSPFTVGECSAHVFEVFHYTAVPTRAEVMCAVLNGVALPCKPEFGCVFTAFRCDALWCEAGSGATSHDNAPLIPLPAGVASLAPTADVGCARFSRSLDGKLRNCADGVAWLTRHLLLGAQPTAPWLAALHDDNAHWRDNVHAPPMVDVSAIFGGDAAVTAIRGGATWRATESGSRLKRVQVPTIIAGVNALDLVTLGVEPSASELESIAVVDERTGQGEAAVDVENITGGALQARRTIDVVFALLHQAEQAEVAARARLEALATAFELYFVVATHGRVILNTRIQTIKI